ncbi:arginine--tRNA ligase [bacterium]|nr:MAG: arginine--tRNA ligase [bacterium]
MKAYLSQKIEKIVKSLFGVEISTEIESPRECLFGNYSSNVAMRLARTTQKSAKDIANEIIDEIKKDKKIIDNFSNIDQKNGFINFKFSEKFLGNEIKKVLDQKSDYGNLKLGKKQKVQLEFGSANPTGPLTIAHGRGIFFGDTLGSILSKAGFNVQKEYYVNDAGKQIDILVESVARKALELKGKKIDFPDYCYQGDYIVDVAKKFVIEEMVDIQELEDVKKAVKEFTLVSMVDMIKKDLEFVNVKYDRWFYESELYNKSWFQRKDEVQKVLDQLDQDGMLYERDGALWFRSTNFGDDKDRVLVKKDGEKTYFASDAAYFKNKEKRKFKRAIEVMGADHHGYMPRIGAMIKALKCKIKVDFILVQIVRLIEGGQIRKVSKRAGEFLTLRDLVDDVGADVTRFFFLMYSVNSHMDFDLDLAREKSKKNPVFYVQYAFARICSIIKMAEEKGIILSEEKTRSSYQYSEVEMRLIGCLVSFSDVIEDSASNCNVSSLAHFSIDLAKSFHDFYEHCKVISEDKNSTVARLQLISAVQIVLKESLRLLGISAPKKM